MQVLTPAPLSTGPPLETTAVFSPKVLDVASFLVAEAVHILPYTPCSLQLVAEEAVRHQVVSSADEAKRSIQELAAALMDSVILEREGYLGHFLIFYNVEALALLTGTTNPLEEPPQKEVKRSANTSIGNNSGSVDSIVFSTSLESLFGRIRSLVTSPTTLEAHRLEQIRQRCPEVPLTQICASDSREKCLNRGKSGCLNKIHFERVVHKLTDPSLGDCSYLDTCFRWRQCKYVHYKLVFPDNHAMARRSSWSAAAPAAQYINGDLLMLDLGSLGNDYAAMIIDPPWEIHTNPTQTYGCTDERVLGLDIQKLQTSGIVFLWVTGRVLDFGRQCLEKWGYSHVEELIWLKTNQLGRTICTGRTGHWLNHTKEHVLVGVKGGKDASNLALPLDTDVLVSSALGRSQKPEELYAIIDRLVGPKAKKLELFGRKSNVRPGWLTIGNEMGSTRIHDPKLRRRLGLA